jgi:23S rRNA (uracil1939-C5)-methyltransferase
LAGNRPRFISPSRTTSPSSLSKGTLFEARVESLTDTGDALVVHPNGSRVFVAGAWLGELIRVSIREAKSQYAIGDLVAVLEASAERCESPCPYQGFGASQCGGCGWMFVSYAAQLAAKQTRVERAIARIQPSLQIKPIFAAPEPLGYRVRAQFKTDGRTLGFVANGKRQLVPVEDCVILSQTNRNTMRALREQLPNSAWQPSKHQDWNTLDIDDSTNAQAVSHNKRLPFQQANASQNEVMRAWLRSKLQDLPKTWRALELFAGSGNFTRDLAAAGFAQVTAVELAADAVNALNHLDLARVEALVCNLFDEEPFNRLLRSKGTGELLVLDPPREGLKIKGELFDKKHKLQQIIYISCDLATLCRDLKEMQQAGFNLREVQPVDLFPQTPHVEVLVHLSRGKL